MELLDLACFSREKRQALYGEILKDSGRFMTPTQVREELEQRGMTFAFVGQDVAAMRLEPYIQIEGRGQYCWNAKFSSVSKTTRKLKRELSVSKDVTMLKVEDEPFKKESKKALDVVEEKGLRLLLSVALCELDAQSPSVIRVRSRDVA
jgi:hypothetical protein